MKISIPCLYASYGRYIDEYRAIPSNVDGLKISLRRALLSLYDMAKDKYTKSARVTGHMIGSYHPHGDSSAYDTIFTLVLQNYALGEGGWGARDKDGVDSPSAQRYTECKLAPWVRDMAFKYIKYVPWKNLELDDEPIFLPCVIPIGLIGVDNISGIGFHKTTIPKYTLEDLAKRLKWLIEISNEHDGYPDFDSNEINEEEFGPLIKPNFRDCKSKENEPNAYYKLLYEGNGSLQVIPKGGISNGKIYIQGRVPSNTFKSLIKDIDNGDLDFTLIDLSGNGDDPYSLNVELTPRKKKKVDELKASFREIWQKYLIRNINYHCYFVQDGVPEILGIDEVLMNNYSHYLDAVLKYRIEIFDKANERLFNNNIILIIKELINKYDVKTLEDLVNCYNQDYVNKKKVQLQKFEDNNFVNFEREISSDDLVNICNKNSITKLITVKVDLNKIQNDIKDAKKSIDNIYDDCYHEVCQYVKE